MCLRRAVIAEIKAGNQGVRASQPVLPQKIEMHGHLPRGRGRGQPCEFQNSTKSPFGKVELGHATKMQRRERITEHR